MLILCAAQPILPAIDETPAQRDEGSLRGLAGAGSEAREVRRHLGPEACRPGQHDAVDGGDGTGRIGGAPERMRDPHELARLM